MKTKSIRTNNSQIPQYWAKSVTAHSNNRQYRTDGQNLYSYNLIIGTTLSNGSKILLDYSAQTGHFRSQTTSQHVGKARRWADQTMCPDVARTAGLIR